MKKILNYIGGEFVNPISGNFIDNINPATGETYSHISDSDADDMVRAVDAAEKAFPVWSGKRAEERAHFLNKIADLIESRLDEFAAAESIDTGKPLKVAKSLDLPRAVKNFRFFAAAATQFASESHSMNGAINYTLRQPRGVVGCISPWNLPLYLFSWKVAPALATGNTVVGKPSEVTPMTAFMLAEVCSEAGLPGGVLNIVQGLGTKAGAALVAHPNVSAISFTGGTKTGKNISEVAGPEFKKLSLELGGKNPNIIFADCNWDMMMETTLRSSFANQGQVCLSGSRIFIEKAVYKKFKEEFVARVKALKVGDPQEDSTHQGAIVSKEHFEKILSYIELAQNEGGELLAGGKAVKIPGRCEKGYFIEPTVLVGLGPKCRTNQEEIFGPVVTLNPFEDEDEVLEYANSTSYGLAASVWTENLSRAHRLGEKIQSGVVWVNCWLHRDLRTPFGGMKNSGVGREGGFEAMRFFTEPKNVCIQYQD